MDLVVAGSVVLGSIGCRGRAPQTPAHPLHPDIVLVTIDTLRADRVGATGGRPGLTPTLDALGRGGAVFTDATAHVPLTLPSHASILTGLYPPRTGVRDNTGVGLPPGMPTLATLTKQAGYRTAAFVGSFVLRGSTGLGRGFDTYDDRFEGAGRAHVTLSSLERRAPEVARRAAAWLRTAGSPCFLWVHFYDPHAPYDPAPAFAARFPGRPYEAEIATADFGLSTVLEALTPVRRARALIVVTGDHGESLGEHGESEHGMLLYDATLHVPLVLAGPGVSSGIVVHHQVRHVDIVPTVLALAGLSVPGHLDGRSLLPLSAVDRSDAPPSYAESRFGELHFGWSPIRSIRDGMWKLIDAPTPELYALATDAVERANVYPMRRELGDAMARILPTLSAEGAAGGPAALPQSDAAERLRSLGYVSGRVTLREGGSLDPKDQIGSYEAYVHAFNAALARLEEDRAADAERQFRALARSYPRSFEAHQYLGRALAAVGEIGAAAAELDAAIALSPSSADLYFDDARVLGDARQFDRAFRRIDEGRTLDPSSFYGALAEGLVARAARQPERAERAFGDAVRLNPALSVAHYELGRLAEDRGDGARARVEYEAAVAGDPSFDAARRALDRMTAPR